MADESGDKGPQIFESHITLRNWALQLVDACGGKKYIPVGKLLNKTNTEKIAVLIDAFAKEHNQINAYISKEVANDETIIPKKDTEGTQTEKTEEE